MKMGQALAYLKNPWIVLASMAVGVGLGLVYPSVALTLEPISDLYLSLLKMCVLPILITAIISSFGWLMMSKDVTFYIKRIIVVFLTSLVVVSALTMLIALIGGPGGGVSEESRSILGSTIFHSEGTVASNGAGSNEGSQGLSSFLTMLIPSNIFDSLVQNHSLQILFFSIILGITVAKVDSSFSESFIGICEVVFKAMEKAFSWMMYLLPFALVSLLSATVVHTGTDILSATMTYVFYVYLVTFIVLVIGTLFIAYYSGMSFFRVIGLLKEPLVLAFGTRNSYACMPSIITTMEKHFNISERLMKLVVPLCVVICRYSMILVFVIGAVYMMNLYGLPITLARIGFIVIAAFVASLATAGTPSILAISLISIVIVPLGVPLQVAVILLLAIHPIVDPILTVVNVFMVCVVTTIISNFGSRRQASTSSSIASKVVDKGELNL
ncbi:MAG TPA: cation:dicarboxylase symporter family transporter [Bacillales bacterium]|nr:cation:dicarboxylase symporter family transporter [Bacillales bacterium]